MAKTKEILKPKGAVSFYNYINDIPTYIHNTERNFLLTSIEIYEHLPKLTSDEVKSIDYIQKIINLQKAREDDILIQLFGNKNCNIMEEFEKAGFILSKEKTQELISKINELKYYDRYKNWVKKYDFIKNKNNLSIENMIEEVKITWNEYRNKVNNIEEALNNILKEVDNSNISSDFISLKKRLDDLKDYSWNKKISAQENMIEELRRTDGIISNLYKDITEGYRKKTEAQIKEEIKSDINGYKFALLKEADEYRAKDENLMTLAKSDQIIVKLEGEVIIPIGGLTVKKSSEGKPKIHQTSSIDAFLKSIKATDYVNSEEQERDINYLKYLFGNRLVFKTTRIDYLTENMEYIIKKYGLIFFAGTIASEVLNIDIANGVEALKISDIFNKEHADFLYITTDRGATIKRASEELEEIFVKGLSISVSFSKKDDTRQTKILAEVSKIKEDYIPYTYDSIISNSSFKNAMNNFYNSIDNNLVIRLDSKGVIL